ncbi:M23 family metallopeptidase [Fulvivirgaceae bacterium BMA10]|uniref:M23 family metallopeptidase n=1 Tax=Splendidivirga corallicola TaxID=3051826 RepID=A0ABT8KL79_9BACT|nr:M23 family metallopeptidase [Fulvivirgaceae bacterium BMA10]
MINLSERQIDYIATDIHRKGLNHNRISTEILDHICCSVEFRMEEGSDFDHAYEMVIRSFGEKGLPELNKVTRQIWSKKNRLKRFSFYFSSIAACLLLLVIVVNAKEKPSVRPFNTDSYELLEKSGNNLLFKIEKGTEIVSVASGIVLEVSKRGKDTGYEVTITHNKDYQTVYSFISDPKVEEGEHISKGQPIGALLGTPHQKESILHYKIINDPGPKDNDEK